MDYTKLLPTVDIKEIQPHTYCNHTEFYRTDHLMVKLEDTIDKIVAERIGTVILEPPSLRGCEHLFSLKYHCKNITKTPNNHINHLCKDDILLFCNQIFAMQSINECDDKYTKPYHLHVGINKQNRKKINMFIIKNNKPLIQSEIIVYNGLKKRNATIDEFNIILNKLCDFKEWTKDKNNPKYELSVLDVNNKVSECKNNQYEEQEYNETEETLDKLIAKAEADNVKIKQKLMEYANDIDIES
eukprot:445365_1